MSKDYRMCRTEKKRLSGTRPVLPNYSTNKPHSFEKAVVSTSTTSSSINFKTKVNSLSYLQLLRITTVLNANTEAEVQEARRSVHSLTPLEREIVVDVRSSCTPALAKRKKNYLSKQLRAKNAIETKSINTDSILSSLIE